MHRSSMGVIVHPLRDGLEEAEGGGTRIAREVLWGLWQRQTSTLPYQSPEAMEDR